MRTAPAADNARAIPVTELAVYVGEGRHVRTGDGAAGVLVRVDAAALSADRRAGTQAAEIDDYLIYLRGQPEPIRLSTAAWVLIA